MSVELFMQTVELTETQIARQDFVDNEIYNLIKKLNPSDKSITWDIEHITKIRDVLNKLYTSDLSLCDENVFYPFLQE
ncbi:hypothetical protein [Candidatus Endomicrobiellum trichonymphae]|uniref:hypothetical protein n=1 Tax=Endomicrobium trichonymphae TaxID=1408204 RepID=UPI0039B824E2